MTQPVGDPVPIVTVPAKSLPVIDGLVPQDVSAGDDPATPSDPLMVLLLSVCDPVSVAKALAAIPLSDSSVPAVLFHKATLLTTVVPGPTMPLVTNGKA